MRGVIIQPGETALLGCSEHLQERRSIALDLHSDLDQFQSTLVYEREPDLFLAALGCSALGYPNDAVLGSRAARQSDRITANTSAHYAHAELMPTKPSTCDLCQPCITHQRDNARSRC
jgi:hypothetical protein